MKQPALTCAGIMAAVATLLAGCQKSESTAEVAPGAASTTLPTILVDSAVEGPSSIASLEDAQIVYIKQQNCLVVVAGYNGPSVFDTEEDVRSTFDSAFPKRMVWPYGTVVERGDDGLPVVRHRNVSLRPGDRFEAGGGGEDLDEENVAKFESLPAVCRSDDDFHARQIEADR